jgi:ribose 5-phosphate isomerase A
MDGGSGVPTVAAERAVELVEDGQLLGLGTGRAASAFLHALARRMHQAGLRVRGVASSAATEELAGRLGIPLVGLAEAAGGIDLTVDGADEVDPGLDVLKGRGGAMLREKVLARMSRRWVLVVGESKVVDALGTKGRVPVEVVPFAVPYVRRQVEALGLRPELRKAADGAYLTDNGNAVLDCAAGAIADAAGLDARLKAISGVVETGLFPGLRPTVLVERDHEVQVLDGA